MKKNWNKISISVLVGLIFLLLGIIAFALLANKEGRGAPWTYMMGGIAALIIIILIAYIVLVQKGKIKTKEPDYRTFFILGIVWIPIGLTSDNPSLWMMGLVFMIIGMINKDKWKEAPKFKDLPAAEKNLKVILMIVLGLMVLTGLAAFLLLR